MRRRSKLKNIFLQATSNKSLRENQKKIVLTYDIKKNEEYLKWIFNDSEDVIFRYFTITFDDDTEETALLVFVDGRVNEDVIRTNIIQALIEKPLVGKGKNRLEIVKTKISVFNEIKSETNLNKAVLEVLQGSALLLLDGFNEGYLMNVAGSEQRALEEPKTERVIKGARDGFIESISINMDLIRRRIPHPSLTFDPVRIGDFSQTQIVVTYVKDIVDLTIVEDIKSRIEQMEMDSVDSSGMIEQLLEDHPFSIFPTIGNTERPDKTAALLMEGRVIILVEGSPIVLYAPFFFLESIHSTEDYTSRPYYTSFIRLIRFIAFLLSVLFPALFIAVLNFHKSMIPSDMLVPLIQSRERVPFNLANEMLLLIFLFEMVREAGVRLPEQIGSALSIVGALIFGQVAVSAGIVGAPTTIVASVSYISSFVNNPISDVVSLLRITFFIAASLFGGFGLFMVVLGLITHMVSLTSVGVPYMAPFAPFYAQDWKDVIFRFPYQWLRKRPKSIPNKRPIKIKSLPKNGDK